MSPLVRAFAAIVAVTFATQAAALSIADLISGTSLGTPDCGAVESLALVKDIAAGELDAYAQDKFDSEALKKTAAV